MVLEFMRKAGQYLDKNTPTIPEAEIRALRVKLILEELLELAEASGIAIEVFYDHSHTVTVERDLPPSPVNAADAIADLLYVVYGAAISWSIHIDPIFGAVHAANMEKFGPGCYTREDGKHCKPPDWQPPDIKSVLEAQGYRV